MKSNAILQCIPVAFNGMAEDSCRPEVGSFPPSASSLTNHVGYHESLQWNCHCCDHFADVTLCVSL